jgi:hypothetical protein
MILRRRRLAALCAAAMLGLGAREGTAEMLVRPALMGARLEASTQAMVAALSEPPNTISSPPMVQVAPPHTAPAPGSGRVRRAAVRGALIGAGAGAAVAILAAIAYGRNEGGGICGACAFQWGPIGIGTGAGIGAGIGALIGAAAPSRQPGLWPPAAPPRSRRRGIAFALRF